jgi:2-polyprenyl-3-methyl-5-hydroxy-6-metoxy-1,4-benzoquinol methylase
MQLQNENAMRQMDAVVMRWGVWTDHNIQIADNVFTIGEAIVSEKVRRVLQVVADLAGKPLSEIRVLDLACLEGQYAVEFARHGARAVAIEGREANFEKANFAKRMLSLDNLQLIRGDVRDLSREKHGVFDVVLCLGILYHLARSFYF